MKYDERLAGIFKALSDPNRLHIFELLTISDLSNSELVNELGLSQNLLSHHLNVLTDAELVTVHQSVGDARRRYYAANVSTLKRMRRWCDYHSAVLAPPLPVLARRQRVLFLCYRNAARSLMAEALARHLAPGALEPQSAGVDVTPVDVSLALEVLRENGVPTEGLHQQTYHAMERQDFDYVITVCDRVHETLDLHTLIKNAQHLHWSLLDPSDIAPDEAGQRAATRQLFDKLEQRITLFVQTLAEPRTPNAPEA